MALPGERHDLHALGPLGRYLGGFFFVMIFTNVLSFSVCRVLRLPGCTEMLRQITVLINDVFLCDSCVIRGPYNVNLFFAQIVFLGVKFVGVSLAFS